MLISSVAIAQKHNIVNASIALRNAKKATGDEIGTLLSEAKDYIDLAYSNESTSNEAKMWNYRAPIYLEIALKKPDLDNKAILKATDDKTKTKDKEVINDGLLIISTPIVDKFVDPLRP